jgi:hypothetical protein
MTSFGLRRDVVSYGIAPTQYGKRNLESSQLLDDVNQHFAKVGIPIEEHLVFSVPATTFTTSTMQPMYHPPSNKYGSAPMIDLCNCLWQLFGRVGHKAMLANFPQKSEDDDGDGDGDGDIHMHPLDSEIGDCAPPLCFEQDGRYVHLHDNLLFHTNFNRWSLERQKQVLEENPSIRVVSLQEYNNEMASYHHSNDSESNNTFGKGRFYVLLEFFEGATNPDVCSGYRIWILKEKGAIGSLSALMGDIIANAGEKPKSANRDWKTKYSAQWRKIYNNNELAKAAGLSLYLNQNQFTGDLNAVPLKHENNPVHPTSVFSCGPWLNVVYGSEENPMSYLPTLFPNLDVDEERFKYTNYFDKELLKFKPAEKFRSSMYLCSLRDLEEDNFMEKYRLDIYKKYILDIMRSTLGVINKPKPIKKPAFPRHSLPVALSANKAWQSFDICPTKEHYLVGQDIDFQRPRSQDDGADKDIVFEPGEGDYFFFLRALAKQHISVETTNAMNVSKTFIEKRNVRIEAWKKCLQFVKPLFTGGGNANVSNGLRGIINADKELRRQRFSNIFLNVENINSSLHFQDLFMVKVLNGAEHYLFLSTLQCELYAMLLNTGCAYMLICDKTHLDLEGPAGTGKSQLLWELRRMKCDGVCVLDTNGSLFSNMFGKHKSFEIALRHEPDPMKNGGKIAKGNLQAMQKMELEKSLLSEQQGRKTLSVFDKDLNKYKQQVIDIILSCVVVQCQNNATDKYANPIRNRFLAKHVPRRERVDRTVAYMQSASGEMNIEHIAEQKIFLDTFHLIDANLGKLCAMMDLPCALTEPNFEILTDVFDYLKSHSTTKIELHSRAMNRCRNNARTQIQYDSLQILFYHRPNEKTLNFYVGDVRITNEKKFVQKKYCQVCYQQYNASVDCCENVDCEKFEDITSELGTLKLLLPTTEMLSQEYTDATNVTLNHQQFCILFRQPDGTLGYEDTHEENGKIMNNPHVNIRIDLIENAIYSVEQDGSELLEPQPLKRKWEYVDLYDESQEYEQGDVVRFHYQGEISNYSSFYEKYEYLLQAGPYRVCSKTGKVFQGKGEHEAKGELIERNKFHVDLGELLMAEKFLEAVDKKEKQLNIQYIMFNNNTCERILSTFDFKKPDSMSFKAFFKQKFKLYKLYLLEFEQVWGILENEDGLTRVKESLLGKYKDEVINFSGQARSIEMWRDIDLLQYCTVDVAIRTVCMMRDEFLPEYTDKMKLAIARIAYKKLNAFKRSKPYKQFLPNNDQNITASADDVDFNYICLDSISQFKIELRELLNQKLTQGLKVDASDIMIERIIDKLNSDELATVRYDELKKPLFIENGVWKLYSNPESEVWKRNHEYGTTYGSIVKMPALKRKRMNLYIHVAWVSDLLHSIDENESQQDSFLKTVQSYRYPGKKGDKKRILIGKPWTGKVTTLKNKKIDWCEPPISAFIEVHAKENMQKSSERKNELSLFSQRIHGRKLKKRRVGGVEKVEMSYDRHIACKRAKQLNELDGPLHKDLYKQYKYLSKEDLLLELQQSQPPVNDYDYPNEIVQQEYDFRTKKQAKLNYYARRIQKIYRGYRVRCLV